MKADLNTFIVNLKPLSPALSQKSSGSESSQQNVVHIPRSVSQVFKIDWFSNDCIFQKNEADFTLFFPIYFFRSDYSGFQTLIGLVNINLLNR